MHIMHTPDDDLYIHMVLFLLLIILLNAISLFILDVNLMHPFVHINFCTFQLVFAYPLVHFSLDILKTFKTIDITGPFPTNVFCRFRTTDGFDLIRYSVVLCRDNGLDPVFLR